jgi:hypothetical protein
MNQYFLCINTQFICRKGHIRKTSRWTRYRKIIQDYVENIHSVCWKNADILLINLPVQIVLNEVRIIICFTCDINRSSVRVLLSLLFYLAIRINKGIGSTPLLVTGAREVLEKRSSRISATAPSMLPGDFHNFSQLLQKPAKSFLNHNCDRFCTSSNSLPQISYSVGADGFFSR